ncbi:MAG: divalent metal cation transporter [Candidatus Aminicenantes bacterium]|nr:divalent metal cation transporter [Candidatus Aminicenantes bacterium]
MLTQTTPSTTPSRRRELRRGFPLVKERDSRSLEAEHAYLQEVNSRPSALRRWRGYWKLTGPGWLQSAITLGAGSAGSVIMAGSAFGYKLLWVSPLAMLLGVAVFASIGRQTLLTQARPYDVFWKRLHPALALFWGLNVLLASIVWQFPQYALGTAVIQDMLSVAGFSLPRLPIAIALLAVSTAVCWSYGRGSRRALRAFERSLKYMLFFMIGAFFLVVVKTGIDLGELVKGFFGFHVPESKEGVAIVLGQLGAAVGVNMTFLFPYTLLARGWGRDHLRLKNFDLGVSMFLPFVLATSFVTIACANTLHVHGIQVRGAVDAAHALEPLVGLTFGRVVFSLGVAGMCFTTMVLEMLLCGFVLSEMFGFELHGKAYKASTMLANVGVLGAFASLPFWVPVATSSLNLIMMPVAYLGFFLLHNMKSYLGKDIVRGPKAAVWNALFVLAILVVAAGAVAKILSLF